MRRTDEHRAAVRAADRALAVGERDGWLDRRRFLHVTAAGLGASLLAACNSPGPDSAKGLLASATRWNERVERWLFGASSRARTGKVLPAGARFPSYWISERVPMWDVAARGVWRLEVRGMVRTPLSLTLDDLRSLQHVTQRVPHYCVEGWTAVADFGGVRVQDLLARAGVQSDAGAVDFAGFDDGYHESWDIESAMHPQTLVVLTKDGQPLNPAYGAPARVHGPVKLGYKNTKYLTTITVLPAQNGGYWTDRGYEWYGGT
jgi:DMSO/TMAO reductase YedYZ molybdopterin-dependent catalytic subunit